jgi:hypothetical protein
MIRALANDGEYTLLVQRYRTVGGNDGSNGPTQQNLQNRPNQPTQPSQWERQFYKIYMIKLKAKVWNNITVRHLIAGK